VNSSQFTVTYNSGLHWLYEGGTNFWTDNTYKFIIKRTGDSEHDLKVSIPNSLGANVN